MFRISGEENMLITCPYDKTHSIRLSRMQVHLIKCRRNHKANGGETLAQCPFNVTHMVRQVELDVHVKICPERCSFEAFRYKDKIVNETLPNYDSSVDGSNLSKFIPLKISSSWDNEPDAPAYDPTSYAKSAKVLREARGMCPSERRAFRASERNRLFEKDCQ